MKTSKRSVSEYQYLIIGGTTKAATTSLFSYLSDHPSICAATYKETRFFLSPDYPLPSKYRYNGDVEEYKLLFSDCQENQIRLESTPDYLYCPSALDRIAEYLPNAKLVFSLREPISRIISWYRFAIQIGRLPNSLSIDEYVELLFDIADGIQNNDTHQESYTDTEENGNPEQFLQVLPQGRYANYLRCYLDRLGEKSIHTFYFEDFSTNPLETMRDLSNFAEIDSTFFDDYTFQAINRTETMRNPDIHKKYRSLRFQVRQWTHNRPVIHKTLRAMRRGFEPLYLRLNTRSDESITLSDNTLKRIKEYYRHDVVELAKLLGKQPPWEPFT